MTTKQYNLGNVRGPQGADGKSAYEVAVENGFTGTESEFLASLIGPVGPKGDPGADGKDGTGVDIKGELSSTDDLPESGSDGEAYLIGGYLWVWDGKEWANAGNIQGPQGTQGLDGKSAYEVAVENGFKGTESEWLASLVGPAGADGPAGSDGQNGADGSAATISVGSVVSGSTVAVENVGTSTNAVLNFTLEKGEKGDTGDPGPKGSDGSNGADGSDGSSATISIGSVTDGSTAAVSNAGTSNAAVLDFVIPRGEKGADGSDGKPGANGSAATIAIGSVTASKTAAVTNVGTSSEALFNFAVPVGQDGAPGSAATIEIGSVTDGKTASVTNVGTSTAAVFNLVLPRGSQGIPGSDGAPGSAGADGSDGVAATVEIGSVTTGETAAVSNAGTSTNAVLDFTLQQGPQGLPGSDGSDGMPGSNGSDGAAATVEIGSVTTGNSAVVSNVGTSTAAVLDFTLPRGETGAPGSAGADGSDGVAATVEIGSVTTGNSAVVSNVGTSTAAVLDFTLPRGETGAPGSAGADGSAATISVGSVIVSDAITVENVGTSTNAVLNFTLEKGEKGDTGDPGPKGSDGSKGADGSDGADGSAATISVGSVVSGSTVAVENVGTSTKAVLNFTLEKGPQGDPGSDGSNGAAGADGSAATIAIGSVVSGSTAAVSNAGTSNSAVLDFVIPRGEKGADGSDGAPGAAGADGSAATISVGSVIVSDATTVENVGTSNAAVLNFTLQQGPAGSTGPQGAPGSDAVLTPATTASLGAVKIGSGISVTSDGTISAQYTEYAAAVNAYIGTTLALTPTFDVEDKVFKRLKFEQGESGFFITSVDDTNANCDIELRMPDAFVNPANHGITIDELSKDTALSANPSIITQQEGVAIPLSGDGGYTVTFDSATGFLHINFNECPLYGYGARAPGPAIVTIPIHISITSTLYTKATNVGDTYVTFTVPMTAG